MSSAPEDAGTPAISKEEALALVQKHFKLPEGPGWLDLELTRYGPHPVWELNYWFPGRGSAKVSAKWMRPRGASST